MKNPLPLRLLVFCVLLLFSAGVTLGDGEPIVHITKHDPSSSTASDGSITLSVSGGTAPYTIYFTSTTMPGKIYKESTITLDGLKTGSYLFTIQDSKGHIVNKSVELQYR
jgi:hypothetical protein